MKLVKYRDAGLPTFTYFWVSEENRIVGPYFNSEKEAIDWLKSSMSGKFSVEQIENIIMEYNDKRDP